MFDIGPSELLLCAIVALVVIGPKDLPRAMRVVGQWAARARNMARHFRSGIDTMIREAELEEMQRKWAEENARIMAEHPMADSAEALEHGTPGQADGELAAESPPPSLPSSPPPSVKSSAAVAKADEHPAPDRALP